MRERKRKRPFISDCEIEESEKRGLASVEVGRKKHKNEGLNDTGGGEFRASLSRRFSDELSDISGSLNLGLEISVDETLRNLKD